MAKGHPPLFEILQRSRGEAPASRPTRPGPPPSARGTVRVPFWALYVVVTGVLGLCVGVWIVAYQMGRSYGEQRIREQMRAGLELSDPLLAGPAPDASAPRDLNGGAPPPDAAAAAPERPPDVREPPFSGDAAVLGPEGPLASDPRAPSTNYLKLATRVPRDEAVRALGFLDGQEFGAFAVRVEAAGRGANNPARYDLYAALAVPSRQFGAMGEQRRALQERAAELGRQWRGAPHRGAYDFSQSVWERYGGD